MGANNNDFNGGAGKPTSKIGSPDLSTEEFNALPYDDQTKHIELLSGIKKPESTSTSSPRSRALKPESADINEVYAAAPRTRAQRTAARGDNNPLSSKEAAKEAVAKLRSAQSIQKQAIKDKINAGRAAVTSNPDFEAEGTSPSIGTDEAIGRLINLHSHLTSHYSGLRDRVAREIAYHQGQAAQFGGEPHLKHIEDLRQGLAEHESQIRTTSKGSLPSLLGNNLVEARALLNTASGDQANRATSISASHTRRAAQALKDELNAMGRTKLGRLGVLPEGTSRHEIDTILSGLKDVQRKSVKYDNYVDNHPDFGPSKPGHVWVGNPKAIAGSPAGMRQMPLNETTHIDFLANQPGATKASPSYSHILEAQKNAKEASAGTLYRGSNEGPAKLEKEVAFTNAKLPKESSKNQEGVEDKPKEEPIIPKKDMVDAKGNPVYQTVNGTLFKIAGRVPVSGQKQTTTRAPKSRRPYRDPRIVPAPTTQASVTELTSMSKEDRRNYLKLNSEERSHFLGLEPEARSTFMGKRNIDNADRATHVALLKDGIMSGQIKKGKTPESPVLAHLLTKFSPEEISSAHETAKSEAVSQEKMANRAKSGA